MSSWQDSIQKLGQRLYASRIDPQKLEYNAQIVKTLVSALKEQHSFGFQFHGVPFISILQSPDGNFRIFSWSVPLSDGSYLYYGAIQNKTEDGSLKLVPLLDQTFEIDNPESASLIPSKWYGAVYYDIILLNAGKYVLLGWKGHTDTYSQKVIEPLIYDGKSFVLGANLFSDNTGLSRKIFNFTREASMYLRYDKVKNRIVFDHIVPADPSMEGNYRYYGPDLTFDSYEIEQGKLLFKSDIAFDAPERGDENQYLDPKILPTDKRSGL